MIIYFKEIFIFFYIFSVLSLEQLSDIQISKFLSLVFCIEIKIEFKQLSSFSDLLNVGIQIDSNIIMN